MDDIWDTKPWDDLKRYFPDDGTRSRILFTTRNKNVGSEASPRSVISPLPFLSEDECWELLRRKVFQDKNCPQELLDIGKQISANCRGLPLAVVVIAGVLANMEKKEHLWQKDLVVIGIEHLVHLRYLTISMESLQRLECLVVDRLDEIEIPDILLNMLSLRHLHFLGGGYFSASCLQQATNNESFQINNNLQSISVIIISDETDLKILRCLPNLRRLKVSIRSPLNYSFEFLNQLESLKLKPYNLSSGLISLPLNLKQLTLVGAHMSLEQMDIIGKLEYLEVLKLQTVDFEENHWDTSEGGFPQLKFLKLSEVQIEEWNTSSDHFPRLQRLVLQSCDGLKMIPPILGDIPALQLIKVYKCAKLSKTLLRKFGKNNRTMEMKILNSS
ncbi:putative late blight resistance protein-like protein R1B-17 [Forsythia ovata]|uniref:Late blight resistance protein-like protein R1B-17 n=1 Tax=Forsythia ovata TaxID=205694 RepID=A0ABD1WSE4_9LAMI